MLYPFKFNPILKPIIWGGRDICTFKNLPSRAGIGESWELSGVDGNISVVGNGELKGKSLSELMASYGEKLLGRPVIERFGNTFPLLIKFIDAKQPLSIQVHPNDELAMQRHNSFGKTEMWYVVKAIKEAYLYSGFKEKIDAETYVQSLQDDTFIHFLQKHDVKQGDAFFLPAGRVHAIGAGCFIAEIQQTSDITYRIYDYNRKDANGQPRELHTELAKDAIDYQVYSDYKIDYQQGKECRQSLVRCSYFSTNLITGKKGNIFDLTYSNKSFVILICLKGNVIATDSQSYSVLLEQGETVLIPAANIHPIQLEFFQDSQLLETYIE
ncbi:MAG: class I mannose-6-phosphate isomerase [Dysgonamonadaceae bacterium]|jgi:mannose-6-phosphate isomerase|nr:class I mannose-6-phosphate isomerase [Dysgonamonadaceae bacterium]